jgi:hypothetical protein
MFAVLLRLVIPDRPLEIGQPAEPTRNVGSSIAHKSGNIVARVDQGKGLSTRTCSSCRRMVLDLMAASMRERTDY